VLKREIVARIIARRDDFDGPARPLLRGSRY
jgi:hypothetical protein